MISGLSSAAATYCIGQLTAAVYTAAKLQKEVKLMYKHRPHRKTSKDANQNEITSDLKKLGFDVDDVSSLRGLYDIVVSGVKRVNFSFNNTPLPIDEDCSVRVEIKMPGKKLSEAEEDYHAAQKHTGSIIVAYNTEDILRWFGRLAHTEPEDESNE